MSTEGSKGTFGRLRKGLADKPIPPGNCPYCEAKDASTPLGGVWRRQSFGGVAEYTFGVCGECGEICGLNVTLVSLEGDRTTTAYAFPQPIVSVDAAPAIRNSARDAIMVPPHLPNRVEWLFRQARQNLMWGNWDAAGMMYRKILEVALRLKFNMNHGTLKKKLERAWKTEPEVFFLFGELARISGNEAAHEVVFDEPGAQLLDSHLEQLLIYLFTVPELKARNATAGPGAAGGHGDA